MSANVVMPERICSAAARRVPHLTKSSVTFFASAGKMYLRSQSSRVTSSCKPRSRVIAACVCPLMNPGRTSAPLASMVCFVKIGPLGMWGRPSPSATIESPLTITKPFSIIRRSASMVTIVPPVIRRSTKLAGFAGACVCPCAEVIRAPAKIMITQASPLAVSRFLFGLGFIFFPCLSQIRRIERFRKKVAHPQCFDSALQICQDHGDIAAKLPDQLAACTAGRRERIRVRDDSDSVKTALAFAHGFENRDTLGADSQAIGGVFHVATAENSSRSGAQRGAYAKIRERRVGILARLARGFDERVMFCHATASRERKQKRREISCRKKHEMVKRSRFARNDGGWVLR